METTAVRDLAIFVAGEPEPAELINHLTHVTLAPLHPASVCLYRLGPADSGAKRREMLLVAHTGLSPREANRYARIGTDFPLPLTKALARSLPHHQSLKILTEEHPLFRVPPSLLSQGSLLLFPLQQAGVTEGIVACTLPGDIPWNPQTWQNALAIQGLLTMYLQSPGQRWTPVRITDPDSAGIHTLTDRQRAILTLVLEGKTTSGISARLGFAESTIKHDVHRAIAALGATTRYEAAERAREFGLLDAALSA